MKLNLIRHQIVIFFLVCFTLPNSIFAASSCSNADAKQKTLNFKQCVNMSQLDQNTDALIVAVRDAPPFIYEDCNSQKLKGISIDYWESVAKSADINYQYVCAGLTDTLELLEQGKIDVAISPLTITKSREQKFDFSHQYFYSGLVFASSPTESNFDFKKAFNTLANTFQSNNTFYLFVIFASLLSVLIFLSIKNIKYYQVMPIMMDKSKPAMVIHVVLNSLLNISGIRKDVFGFSSISMQLFSVLILIFGITVSASLFSMVTAALTQSVSPKKDFTIRNIHQHSVATLRGSTAEKHLNESGVQLTSNELFDTWKESLLQVAEGKKDIVFGDWAQLVYMSLEPELIDKVTVHGQSFQFEPYGWGIKENLDEKDVINQELIGLLRHQLGNDIVKRYIGEKQISSQIH